MVLLLHVIRADDSFGGLGIIGVVKNFTSELCEGSGWGELGTWNRSESIV